VPAVQGQMNYEYVPLMADILLAEKMGWTLEYVKTLDRTTRLVISTTFDAREEVRKSFSK
jgi:hypothetical protein